MPAFLTSPRSGSTVQRNAALRVVLLTIALSVCGVLLVKDRAWSDGHSAAALDILNLALLTGYAVKSHDRAFGRLLCFGAAFGVCELIADALCVRFTHTLDYSVSHSALLGLSPWWMPGAWAVVSVQIGYVGLRLMDKYGARFGILLTALLGAVNIPFYEEMAWHAHWWRYQNCTLWGHTPVYLVVSELLIGAALGPLACLSLRSMTIADAVKWGVVGGVVTILAGLIGYGLVERVL